MIAAWGDYNYKVDYAYMNLFLSIKTSTVYDTHRAVFVNKY